MFLKYDKDNDQKLSISELRNMLAEISGKDPADITSHEVSFALRMADTKNQDGEIDRDEAAGAIAAWNVLQQDQDFWGGATATANALLCSSCESTVSMIGPCLARSSI